MCYSSSWQSNRIFMSHFPAMKVRIALVTAHEPNYGNSQRTWGELFLQPLLPANRGLDRHSECDVIRRLLTVLPISRETETIRFDILVNGGSMVTLQFQRSPFHPIKRTVLVPWNEIVVIQSPIVMSAGGDSDQLQQQLFALTTHLSPSSSLTTGASEEQFLSSILQSVPDPLMHGNAPSPATSSSFLASHLRSSSAQMHHRINGSAAGPAFSSSSSSSASSSSSPTTTSSSHPGSGAASAGLICADHNYERMKPRLMEHGSPSASIPSAMTHSSSSSSGSPSASSSSSSSSSSSQATQESAGIAESQILEESLTIPGSRIKLMYRSSSAPGFLSTFHLQLTSSSVLPTSLKLIHVRVIVEGILFSKLLEPDSNLRFTYAWNKRNVYRQKVYGLTTAKGKPFSSLRPRP